MEKLKRWYKRSKIHLLVWMLYMLYEALLLKISLNDWHSQLNYLSHYVLVIGLFYLHSNVVLHHALRSRLALSLLPILVLAEMAVYVLLQYLDSLLLVWAGISGISIHLDSVFILRNLYRGILFMGFATGYYFLKNYLIERSRVEELERARLKAIIQQQAMAQELMVAQHAFLKAQINPHFLFNTLDFVYHNVNQYSAKSGEVILRLAEMMRFAIDSAELEQGLPLEQEIEQVKNLIYLHQVRKNHNLPIEFSYTQEVKALRFIPLVLLTLAENIFKHADLSKEKAPAEINVFILDNQLHIRTCNLIGRAATKSHHSGLMNIEKRLIHAYGDHIVFEYGSIDGYFKVQIQLPLKSL